MTKIPQELNQVLNAMSKGADLYTFGGSVHVLETDANWLERWIVETFLGTNTKETVEKIQTLFIKHKSVIERDLNTAKLLNFVGNKYMKEKLTFEISGYSKKYTTEINGKIETIPEHIAEGALKTFQNFIDPIIISLKSAQMENFAKYNDSKKDDLLDTCIGYESKIKSLLASKQKKEDVESWIERYEEFLKKNPDLLEQRSVKLVLFRANLEMLKASR